MTPILAALGIEALKTVGQIATRPKTGVKEATAAAFIAAMIPVINSYNECQCFNSLTADQWAVFIVSGIAFLARLNAKRVEAK